MFTIRSLVAGGAALIIAASSAVRAQAPAPSALPPMLRSGDVLRVAVWRNPELSGDLAVGDDGTLQHPMYRDVHVAGLARPEVTARVRAALLRFEDDPQFVLEPLYRVSVVGEVRTPNLYSVAPGVTVAQAVALAGGRTERARARAVLARDGRRVPVDLDRPSEGGAALRVQSGDQVDVERGGTPVTTVISVASAVIAGITSLVLIGRSR